MISDRHDAFADVVPYFHRERDDQQAARELAEERQQRATEIIRKLYWYAYSCGQQTLDVSEQDFRFLCAELGLELRDINRS